MPDLEKIWTCQVCKREYKFADHHRCLDNGFEQLEYKRLSPDYAHKREYAREYMKKYMRRKREREGAARPPRDVKEGETP